MRVYNRTEAAARLLEEIQQWCDRTATPTTAIGDELFRHSGFYGLLKKRLTVTPEKEVAVRSFMAANPEGMPATPVGRHAAGIMERRVEGPLPPVVHRDPCPRCGTRGDIDCGHSRNRLGMML